METGNHCSDAEKNWISLDPDPFVFIVVSISLQAPFFTLVQRCSEVILVLQIIEIKVVKVECDVAIKIQFSLFPFLITLFPFLFFA